MLFDNKTKYTTNWRQESC